jgi:hypothetical protein
VALALLALVAMAWAGRDLDVNGLNLGGILLYGLEGIGLGIGGRES